MSRLVGLLAMTRYLRTPAGDSLASRCKLSLGRAIEEGQAALAAWDSYTPRRPRDIAREGARVAEALRRLIEMMPE